MKRVAALVFACVGWTVPAAADEPPATFHKGQIGISARIALGLRGIAPHDQNVYCGKTDSNTRTNNAEVCTGRAPLSLDLEVAYGVARHIELVTEFRLGLEKDFGSAPNVDDGPRTFHIAPGARFFFSEGAHSKAFVQPMVVFDFTRSTAIGFRGLEGYWIDLHRTYGFYVYLGESAEVTPWIVAELEGGIGFQARYP